MRPVRRGDEILRAQGRTDTDGTRFLTLTLVDRAGHGPFQEEKFHLFLEFPDEKHSFEQVQEKGFLVAAFLYTDLDFLDEFLIHIVSSSSFTMRLKKSAA